jgi:uncharacterized protein with PIN domain
MSKSASFYFHDSLNDFLSSSKKNTNILYHFDDRPTVKHAIETIGIPHPEVDVILVNNSPVDFFYTLADGDKVEVYPVTAKYEFDETWSLTKDFFTDGFILDVHLGKLARLLRLLGFDTLYENNYTDKGIVEIAESENRAVLTRDVNLLKHRSVKAGYWLRSQFAEEQCMEVIRRFKLETKIKPFERCVECNGTIMSVSKEAILDRLLPKTILYYYQFFQCNSCKRIYWRGSHYQHMQQLIDKIKSAVLA